MLAHVERAKTHLRTDILTRLTAEQYELLYAGIPVAVNVPNPDIAENPEAPPTIDGYEWSPFGHVQYFGLQLMASVFLDADPNTADSEFVNGIIAECKATLIALATSELDAIAADDPDAETKRAQLSDTLDKLNDPTNPLLQWFRGKISG